MKDAKQPERMTLREFKFWLEGLLSGNDNPRDLPKRDQWQQIMTRIELIDDPSSPVKLGPLTSKTVTISDGSTGLHLGSSGTVYTTSAPSYTHGYTQSLSDLNFLNFLNCGGINGSSG